MKLLPSYLIDSQIWINLYPLILFPAIVSLVFVWLLPKIGTGSPTNSEIFVLTFALAILGMAAGQLTGQSREPAVNATVPAVLTLFGSFSTYFIAKEATQRVIVAGVMVAFTLNLIVGSLWGSHNRAQYAKHLNSEGYRAAQDRVDYRLELQRLEYEKKLFDIRAAFGIPKMD